MGRVRKRRGGNLFGVSREVEDGGEDGKVVHATVCGTLASVVCVSDDTATGESPLLFGDFFVLLWRSLFFPVHTIYR